MSMKIVWNHQKTPEIALKSVQNLLKVLEIVLKLLKMW